MYRIDTVPEASLFCQKLSPQQKPSFLRDGAQALASSGPTIENEFAHFPNNSAEVSFPSAAREREASNKRTAAAKSPFFRIGTSFY
jgi:hypothetical protein